MLLLLLLPAAGLIFPPDLPDLLAYRDHTPPVLDHHPPLAAHQPGAHSLVVQLSLTDQETPLVHEHHLPVVRRHPAGCLFLRQVRVRTDDPSRAVPPAHLEARVAGRQRAVELGAQADYFLCFAHI